ncbi:olfactory receptor 1K1-like [Eublepharis macularius]|uniref:Olfactory receptor n=1 Tax=Eublepharis macularius TaxID=481883 RepID=A0AA97KMD9_EUBMA|nr:olfactory receptor 1K1-like [Eublepharis macularius]XP_054859229.1 olfactory receptor 1K1-like [Eublepharis macularius]
MGSENLTIRPEFVLLGLSSEPGQRKLLFTVFLVMYIVAILGNLLIMLLIIWDAHLHTPMYFFVSHLSLVDACFTSVTVPKMLANLVSEAKTISYAGCLTQMYFFFAFGVTDSFLLAAMAYDRYVAIRNPLHYTSMMSGSLCVGFVASSWIVSHLHSLLHIVLMSRLSFCASREIPHFFCDHQPVLALSCTDTSLIQMLIFTEGALVVLSPFVFIVISYALILVTVLKLPSGSGWRKAFSTCGAHLSVVTLFYGTVIGVYFQPTARYSAEKGRVTTVMYTIVTPMLNPFIYSLRNNDVKGALRRALCRKVETQ